MHSSLVSAAALLLLLAVALASARPDGATTLDFDGDNHHHTQQWSAGNVVTGTYGWTSPEGYNFLVKYIADENGFRVVESNAVPINADGIYADGKQGAFESDEYEN